MNCDRAARSVHYGKELSRMKYRVHVPITASLVVEVEAEDAEQAIEAVNELPQPCHHCAEFLDYSTDNADWDNAQADLLTMEGRQL